MMDKIIMAGFGGQGVMFIGKVLAVAGMNLNLELCWIPSYGPEMRGGTANCSVLLSDREIYSHVIDQADAVIVLNQPAYEKFSPRVKPNGTLIMNQSLIETKETNPMINRIAVPATQLASEMGSPGIANMICLGALIPSLKLLDLPAIEHAIKKLTVGRPDVMKDNSIAVHKGMAWAMDENNKPVNC